VMGWKLMWIPRSSVAAIFEPVFIQVFVLLLGRLDDLIVQVSVSRQNDHADNVVLLAFDLFRRAATIMSSGMVVLRPKCIVFSALQTWLSLPPLTLHDDKASMFFGVL
jgi:hypothetical protein